MRSTAKLVASAMLVSCVLGVSGCDERPTAVDPSPIKMRDGVSNGFTLNDANVNGFTLNGFTLNGESFNGFTLNGFTLNGFTLNGFTLNGSSFHATHVDPNDPQSQIEVEGEDMIGAEIVLSGDNGIYILTLQDIYPDTHSIAEGVLLYDIDVYDIFQDTHNPLCTLNGQPTGAIALRNAWNETTGDRIDDPDLVTFACRGGALSKCVEWGYPPWASATYCEGNECDEVSLAEYHQGCTRMVRADYCGDGIPHTISGTLIDIYDNLSPQIQTAVSEGQSNWGVEAEWGPDGAVCIGDAMRLELLDYLSIEHDDPACIESLDELPNCGSLPASRGGNLATRFCHDWGHPNGTSLCTSSL